MSTVSERSTFTTISTSAFGPHRALHSFPTRRSSDLVPPLFADTKLVFAGTWSVRLTPRASDGPPLCTVIELGRAFVWTTGTRESGMVTARWAEVLTVVSVVFEVLLVVLPSAVPVEET